ncbi:MAG: hypothetical protein C0519_09210 [Hyphomicrobium sp.]|nr:hypothetical protein [Hyphomicrobium sp.]
MRGGVFLPTDQSFQERTMIGDARFATRIADALIAALRQSGLLPAATLPLPVVARCRRSASIIRLQD